MALAAITLAARRDFITLHAEMQGGVRQGLPDISGKVPPVSRELIKSRVFIQRAFLSEREIY